MDFFEVISSRRTIRDFAPREVEFQVIEKIISAGFQAPSNDHMRSWHFVLLQEKSARKELLDKVIHPLGKEEAVEKVDQWGMSDLDQREMYIDAIPKQYSMLYNAGVLLIPCFMQRSPLLEPQNLSALNGFASIWMCIENMLLAAAAEGIFGVVRIPFEEERKTIKQFVQLPDEYEVPCYLALGYPAEGANRAKQVKLNVLERMHFNKW